MKISTQLGLFGSKAGTFRPKICNAFESDSDDDSTSKKKSAKIPQSKPVSIKKEDLEDPSIYEYDAIYDDMKAKKTAEIAPKVKKSSRYIDHLLKAADKRKKEYERRVERKVQLEREKEGDEFEDKEMFVSATYKKKLQEREEEEERERRENQLNDMMDVTKQKDLSGFYRHFLKQSVGEEKIPVFGGKFNSDSGVKDSSSKLVIKEEPISESDHEQSSAKEVSKLTEQDKDYDDSDDSSSEESGKEIENSYERSQSVNDYPKNKDKDSSDKESDKRMSSRKSVENSSKKGLVKEFSNQSKIRNLRKRERSKSISDEEREISSKSVKMTKDVDFEHNVTKDSDKNSVSAESNEEKIEESLEVHNEPSDSSDQTPENNLNNNEINNETEGVDCNNEEPKKKRNIFEKRTVGDLFAAAQTRYFQRLASRTAL